MQGSFKTIGEDHIKRDEPCQDAAIHFQKNNFYLIAVSDGAGSAKHSELGSRMLLTLLAELFSFENWDKTYSLDNVKILVKKSIDSFRTESAALKRGSKLGDYACTLVGVLGSKGGKYISFHIGDGAIISIEESNAKLVSNPENGEYANETYFVTSSNWEEHLRFGSGDIEKGTVMVMTDGVTPFAIAKDGPFEDFLRPLVNFITTNDDETVAKALEQTLSGPKASSICKDDKALAWNMIP